MKERGARGPTVAAIAQTDALGDVVTSLPLAGVIKANEPQARIVFIGRSYTRELILASSLVDHYLDVAEVVARPSLLSELGAELFVNPYLPLDIGLAARRAGIAVRIGNLRRPSSLLWANRCIAQNSGTVQRHRTLMNLAYLAPLGMRIDYSMDELAGMTALERSVPLQPELATLLDPRRFNLVLHPKSGRHAREWPVQYFERLVRLLPRDRFKVFVTGVTGEGVSLKAEGTLLDCEGVVDLTGRLDLAQLIAFLKAADGFVGNSTGPLHIAACLGIRSLGLYPGRDSATAERWRPLGLRSETLSFRDHCEPGPGRCPKNYSGGECSCMNGIPPERVAARVLAWAGL